MAYYWTPACFTCESEGPDIRSGSGDELRFGRDHDASTRPLKAWLDEHEHHDVRLVSQVTQMPWRRR